MLLKGIVLLFLGFVLTWWFVTRPSDRERAAAVSVSQRIEEFYNSRDFDAITSSLTEAPDVLILPAGTDRTREFLGRLLPHLRSGTGPCDTEAGTYAVYRSKHESIIVRSELDCEASELMYFTTWVPVSGHLQLVNFELDGSAWNRVPGLSARRFEIVGAREPE